MLVNHYIQNVQKLPDVQYSVFRVQGGHLVEQNDQQFLAGTLFAENMMTRETFGFKDIIFPIKFFPEI